MCLISTKSNKTKVKDIHIFECRSLRVSKETTEKMMVKEQARFKKLNGRAERNRSPNGTNGGKTDGGKIQLGFGIGNERKAQNKRLNKINR